MNDTSLTNHKLTISSVVRYRMFGLYKEGKVVRIENNKAFIVREHACLNSADLDEVPVKDIFEIQGSFGIWHPLAKTKTSYGFWDRRLLGKLHLLEVKLARIEVELRHMKDHPNAYHREDVLLTEQALAETKVRIRFIKDHFGMEHNDAG